MVVFHLQSGIAPELSVPSAVRGGILRFGAGYLWIFLVSSNCRNAHPMGPKYAIISHACE
jgi:hypothetical protein